MAATLNSFLGNLDKVPEYIDECKRLGVEILKPDINKSATKFIVNNNKIRFGLGSIKNVGIGAVEAIVLEREKNGTYKSFTDFCERINGEAVNKKCIESLIKAGCFDEFEQTRATLLASFENILETISNSEKKSLKGQVSMFELGTMQSNMEEIKYHYEICKELPTKELLFMEKEMLGIYISGHPLEDIRESILSASNINSLQMHHIEEQNLKDGQNVTYIGIINSIKKKYTKNNTIMAFVKIEDLYGVCEIIVFDSCYQRNNGILIEDAIVKVEGRLSIREDDEPKIVANSISEFTKQSKKVLNIDITNLPEESKDKLRGFIKFFSGERNNIAIQIKNGQDLKPAGTIKINKEILEELYEIVGEENAKIIEV